MPLTLKHRATFTAWYCILFYALMLYKLSHGMLLFQLQPFLYNTRFDLITWLMMKTGIHARLLHSPISGLFCDILFYIMPLLYWLTFKRNIKVASGLAVIMLAVNWIYIECYTLYPANSIESFTAWLLFPFLLMTTSLSSFYYVMHSLRYFFLFFFVSAAIWKIVQHGIFNPEEMSGILLFQHKEYLISSPEGKYSQLIYWLIKYPLISYMLYVAGFLFEISFVAGFFTGKYDRLLVFIFLIFLIMDIFIMRIPYWEVLPFMLPLLYSRYKQPSVD